jgi:hypothetical protein
MIDWTHFVHKFKNSSIALPISHEEKVKDVFFKSGGIINIHCKTIEEDPSMFTICMEYIKATFHLPVFFKSLEKLKYGSLFKEVEKQVDRKMWLNKEGLRLGAKAIASQIRQLLLNIATMMASNKHLIEKMRSMDLTRLILSQGRSQGFAFATPQFLKDSFQ